MPAKAGIQPTSVRQLSQAGFPPARERPCDFRRGQCRAVHAPAAIRLCHEVGHFRDFIFCHGAVAKRHSRISRVRKTSLARATSRLRSCVQAAQFRPRPLMRMARIHHHHLEALRTTRAWPRLAPRPSPSPQNRTGSARVLTLCCRKPEIRITVVRYSAPLHVLACSRPHL